jgi:hypothetical protein
MGYTRRDVGPIEHDTDPDESKDAVGGSLADVLSGRLADLDVDSVTAVRAVRERE